MFLQATAGCKALAAASPAAGRRHTCMAALPTPPPAAARKIPEETAGSANGAAVADPTFLGRRGRRDAHIYLPSTFGGGGRDPSLLTVFRASPKEPVGWGPGSLEGAAARGGAPLPWVWDLPFAQDKRIHPGRGIVRPPRFPETHKKNLVGVGGGVRDMWTVLGHLMSSAPA